jgi:hypothetical protein
LSPLPHTAEIVRDNDEAIDSRAEPLTASNVSPSATANASPPRTPQEICAHSGSEFLPPGPHDRVGVALETLQLLPLNVRRVTPEHGHSGWYVWGGEGRSSEVGFFQSLPVARLLERHPQIMPFLALAPGWRVQWRPEAYQVTPPHDLTHETVHKARRSTTPHAPASAAPYVVYRPKHDAVTRYVVLSILLHMLVFVLLGDTGERGAPGRSGARPAVSGFQATLQPAAGSAPVTAPPARMADSSRLRTRGVRNESKPEVGQEATPGPSPAQVPVAAAAPTAPLVTAEPLMPALISTPVDKAMSEFVVPQVTELKDAIVAPVRALEPQQKLDPIVPPKSERTIAIPAELIPRLTLITPPKTATETALPAELIPRLAPIAPIKIERETAMPAELVQRLAPLATPTTISRETAIPAELVPRLSPIEVPRVTQESALPAELVPRLTPLTAPKIEREVALPAELLPRLAPIAAPSAMETLSPAKIERPAVSGPAPAATASPGAQRAESNPASGAATTAPPGGAAGTTRGGDIFGGTGARPGASGGTGTPGPRIDLDAIRQRARELASDGAGPRTLLPFPTVKPKDDAKTRTETQQAFDKALKRPDCRDAYANMGLAAVVPLVRDALTEKGCKW